jgi:hypothetical protein
MSPVSAKEFNYHIYGKVGYVFEFSSHYADPYVYTTGDVSEAFDKSGLFTGSYNEKYDKGLGIWIGYYTYTAVKAGYEVVKTDRWLWKDPNFYFFNITA